ncbi:F510_1955 family glycosylhydrolase [Nonomuraea sp. NPDC049309]|uniref:F510_1955 family glycosylhydrolase n=1 Tax=Nonomuraea sp. NPDC049309 TaxID=3364350 RepID=UPI0037237141
MRGIRAVVSAIVVMALASCGQSGEPAQADDPGIGHIHGLGVDPADGAVYLAGHYGLFKVTSAHTAERVAGRVQDHMGFTVVGPKTFLASGHPGEADTDSPPNLGLIRTTDAGETWETVSELGISDFHALQPAGATLYAYDSQTSRVRASVDGGATWRQGAPEEVIDFAANAAQPERVYAATTSGVQVSGNGGMDFEPVKDAPPLGQIEAPAADLLIGSDVDGQVHMSVDAGKTWRTSGRLPAPPVAFTAVDRQRLLAATEDGTVYESRNGGTDFTVVFRPASVDVS